VMTTAVPPVASPVLGSTLVTVGPVPPPPELELLHPHAESRRSPTAALPQGIATHLMTVPSWLALGPQQNPWPA